MSMTENNTIEYPYVCQIDVSFPNSLDAKRAMQVLQVDKEPGNRVVKSFSLINKNESSSSDDDDDAVVILRV